MLAGIELGSGVGIDFDKEEGSQPTSKKVAKDP